MMQSGEQPRVGGYRPVRAASPGPPGRDGLRRDYRSRSLLVQIAQLRIEHLWMAMPFFTVAWMGFMHPLRRLDFWWHLKVGEVIVTTRHIPRVDLFSFTHAGQSFVHQNWLGEVLYYLTYRAGGFPLLVVLNTMLLAAALLPVWHLCLQSAASAGAGRGTSPAAAGWTPGAARVSPSLGRESTGQRRVAALSSLGAAFVLGMYSNLRPQVYSFLLFALFYWILWGYREGRRDLLWLLPLLMALWANLHGAFVLGIGLTAAVLGMEMVRGLLCGQGTGVLTHQALARLALVLVLTALAPMINPEGYRVFAYVRELQMDPVVRQLVTEWQAPDIQQLNHVLMFFAPLFLASLALHYSRKRLDATELGLLIVFAVLGLSALRNGIWFALIAAPMVARRLPELEVAALLNPRRSGTEFQRTRAWPPLRTLVGRLQIQRPVVSSIQSRLNGVILVCLVSFTVLLSPWVRPHLKMQGLRTQLLEIGTPVGAMDYIAEHGLMGNVFHPQNYGDYLIWRLWPQQKSFIDGRTHLFSLSFIQDYLGVFHDAQWESRLAKYDIRYLLLPKGDASCALMIKDAQSSPRWKLLYEDNLSVLFEAVVVAELH